MADRHLIAWTVGSFHAAGVTLAAVALGHADGALSDLLGGLGTLPGVLGYGYLWVLTYLAGRWVLEEDVVTATVAGAVRPVLVRGSVGGILVGAGALLGPLAVLVVPEAVGGDASLGSLAVVTLYGTGIAMVAGAILGLAFTLVDLAALALARRVRPTRDRR